jgi:transcriptional regulator GlxA family with amidase domain
MKMRSIAIVAYDGVAALDVSGPADVFSTANKLLARRVPAYEVVLLGVRRGPLRSESGVSFYADSTLRDARLFDTVVVPGGEGLRLQPVVRAAVAAFLTKQSRKARRIASVCTGIYALAQSGLLDGHTVTTHWRYADEVQRRWPELQVTADAIFVDDGKFFTSAGVTAGIDLTLAFVERDHGRELALAVAREIIVYLKRSGGQRQYSQPLLAQTKAGALFGDIGGWIRGNLHENLTLEKLAERANLSPRHFARKFKSTFGVTPADFVEELRLDEARWVLVNGSESISQLADVVGYTNDDTFRRAFERRFGIPPAEYRRRFQAGAAG